jgi:hypothetical protein
MGGRNSDATLLSGGIIRHLGDHTGPREHDFQHRFAIKWEQEPNFVRR